MRVCKTEDLKNGDVLAQAVLSPDYSILLSEGTVLNRDYIKKLNDFYIEEVFISINPKEEEALFIEEIETAYKGKVKKVLERHIYHNNDDLIKLSETADNIIENILKEKEVVERLYELKERAPDIYEHSVSVCSLSILIALKFGLDQTAIHDIGVAGLLHDLGLRYMTLIYTDLELSILPANDIAEYKKHPVNAYSALIDEKWISERSKNIILNHHEHINGTGYPLKVKKISIESKILNICEAFDEMICGIGYERKKVSEAIEELKTFKNIWYDGKILDAFLQFAAVYPTGSYVVTNEGEIGIVLRQNNHFPDKPFIKIVKDKTGNTVLHDMVKDLSVLPNIYIENVIDNHIKGEIK